MRKSDFFLCASSFTGFWIWVYTHVRCIIMTTFFNGYGTLQRLDELFSRCELPHNWPVQNNPYLKLRKANLNTLEWTERNLTSFHIHHFLKFVHLKKSYYTPHYFLWGQLVSWVFFASWFRFSWPFSTQFLADLPM